MGACKEMKIIEELNCHGIGVYNVSYVGAIYLPHPT